MALSSPARQKATASLLTAESVLGWYGPKSIGRRFHRGQQRLNLTQFDVARFFEKQRHSYFGSCLPRGTKFIAAEFMQ
jgi:hypothetical protein